MDKKNYKDLPDDKFMQQNIWSMECRIDDLQNDVTNLHRIINMLLDADNSHTEFCRCGDPVCAPIRSLRAEVGR